MKLTINYFISFFGLFQQSLVISSISLPSDSVTPNENIAFYFITRLTKLRTEPISNSERGVEGEGGGGGKILVCPGRHMT